jgi:DNA-binding transcriptional MerR regulator
MTARETISVGSTIGLVAERFGLTHRAIRFYEERGLVSPARDERNRRVFNEAARRRLQVIAALRRSHLPLPDIEDVLACPGGEAAQIELALAKLGEHRRRLTGVLRDIEDAGAQLTATLRREAA